jgi:hypothetical protein
MRCVASQAREHYVVRDWVKPALRLLVPMAVALIVLRSEQQLTILAQERPGVIPVAMVALVAGLLSPYVRRWLIVTLCFGISLLALRDTFRIVPLPPAVDYVWVERIYPFGWGLLSLLAALAGAVEALQPGSVLARRCYFAAASLYFSGHGLISFLKVHNWQSLILFLTGLVALVGVFTAHRIVAAEEATASEDADIQALAERNAERERRLASREWREAQE